VIRVETDFKETGFGDLNWIKLICDGTKIGLKETGFRDMNCSKLILREMQLDPSSRFK
jgi:hypothetical protein